MQANAKLEPRLEQRLASLGAEAGAMIPVLIELASPLRPPRGGDRHRALRILGKQSRRLQQDVVKQLAELGARNIQQSTIANAVSAELAPAAIVSIASHPQVRLVRISTLENVTTSDD